MFFQFVVEKHFSFAANENCKTIHDSKLLISCSAF